MYLFCIEVNSISPHNSSEYWVWVQVKDEEAPNETQNLPKDAQGSHCGLLAQPHLLPHSR
jgi:hypothetical protein